MRFDSAPKRKPAAKRPAAALPSKYTAWVLSRALEGKAFSNELNNIASPYRGVASYINMIPGSVRTIAWYGFLYSRDDHAEIMHAVASAKPDDPPPERPV